jgi:hypothetical protein
MQSATFCREKARVSSAAALRHKLLLPPKERRASKEAAGNSPDLRCGLNRCCPPDCELLPMQLLSAVELCSCSSAETPPHATAGLDAASVPSSHFEAAQIARLLYKLEHFQRQAHNTGRAATHH